MTPVNTSMRTRYHDDVKTAKIVGIESYFDPSSFETTASVVTPKNVLFFLKLGFFSFVCSPFRAVVVNTCTDSTYVKSISPPSTEYTTA